MLETNIREILNELQPEFRTEIEKSLDLKTFRDFKDISEKIFIETKLKENNYNVSTTAKKIGLQRSHVYNKIDLFNIEIPVLGSKNRPSKRTIQNSTSEEIPDK